MQVKTQKIKNKIKIKKDIDKKGKVGYNNQVSQIRRSTQVGRRGAPAKGVGRVYRRESSNLSFSAKHKPQFRYKGIAVFAL